MKKNKDDLILNPFKSLFELNKEFSRLFEGLVGADEDEYYEGFRPDVDIVEEGGQYKIKADMPGMKEDDIEVTISDGIIMIKGERAHEKSEETKTSHRMERSFGKFVRKFTLPKGVDPENVKAVFKNGVLEINLPILEDKKEKKITIESE